MEKLPRHIAIIMDGNGRWAQRQGLPRIEGHRRGVAKRAPYDRGMRPAGNRAAYAVLPVERELEAPAAGARFSDALARAVHDRGARRRSWSRTFRCRVIGRREGHSGTAMLAEMDQDDRDDARAMAACGYAWRSITAVASRDCWTPCDGWWPMCRAGRWSRTRSNEETIAERLYTAGMPDPDLLIRTAGEMRVSNFLLWQISYAEIWVTEHCWPEFQESDLHRAIAEYAARERPVRRAWSLSRGRGSGVGGQGRRCACRYVAQCGTASIQTLSEPCS